MEQLERGDITVEDIDNAQVQRLIYNILPSGDTFLHKFSKKTEVIEAIFNICHPNP